MLRCSYLSSIFQTLSSRPLLPCGLRVAVIHSCNTAAAPLLLSVHNACKHTARHVKGLSEENCDETSLSFISPART